MTTPFARLTLALTAAALVLVGLNVVRYIASPAAVAVSSPALTTDRAGMGHGQ